MENIDNLSKRAYNTRNTIVAQKQINYEICNMKSIKTYEWSHISDTDVVVPACEWFAVGATSGQIDLRSLLMMLMMNDKRGVDHRDESDAEM